MLACGPYFKPEGLLLSAVVLVLLKPLAYFAYILAFRYRVAREIPMTIRQAAGLAVLRTLVGIVLIGGGTLVFAQLANRGGIFVPWGYLVLSRIAAWWMIGHYAARLRGARLAAWISFGTLINIGFDATVAIGLFSNLFVPFAVLAMIAGVIGILHVTGRRAGLRSRFFSHPICTVCEYNLTGNLSGICPECGTPIQSTATA
jgi:hypothetical protein